MFGRSQGDPPETPNKLIPRLKNPLFPQAETGTKLLKRRKNLYVDLQQFATLFLPQESAVFSPDGNSPGNTMENSGKQNPKMGFKSPPGIQVVAVEELTFGVGMPFPADLIPLTALPVSAREWARIISFNGNKHKSPHQPSHSMSS